MRIGQGTLLSSLLFEVDAAELTILPKGSEHGVSVPLDRGGSCVLVVRREDAGAVPLPSRSSGVLRSLGRIGTVDAAGGGLRVRVGHAEETLEGVLEHAYDVHVLRYEGAGNVVRDVVEVCLVAAREPVLAPTPPAQDLRGGTVFMASVSHRGMVFCDTGTLDRVAEEAGPNLMAAFTTTELGNELMTEGAILPILGIAPWSYRVLCADDGELAPEFLGSARSTRAYYRMNATSGGWKVFRGEALDDWRLRDDFFLFDLNWDLGDAYLALSHWCWEEREIGLSLHSFFFEKLGSYEGQELSPPWINR